ncbi:PREDICTED: PMS1 protein homolog 1-like [Eufriesea mexicana]|uniref:PMS1 protein homolog 1-like n=1 Tax=Eufriesea mexicana TaxID=516756 RepID=UPI00083C7426|nr:PREDICTED: PMS1 protein homolog 1-like [Eufriesea mexicana]
MIISALDKDTVKLITTTQIITSISTAVKELLENALDADAKNVEINLIDSGCTLIEVKDDGYGISKIDAPYMALSAYTSKIHSFSDLDSLETYGFRGEALHALSSVSDLTIISKREQDEIAASYTIDHYGHIISSEPCHRSTGTTVQVKQLFKHMPVRRQIITHSKKANQDIKTLESLIRSYGICKFFVRISYKVDNNIIFAKPSLTSLEEAVTYTLGKKVTCNMNWMDITDTDIKMKIMVPSKPIQNVSEVFHSGAQYIFANNRPIKHKELEKIVIKIILEALEQELSLRKKPIFVLYILINAANVDINLEPNKTFALFKDQNMVINMVEKYLENFYGIQREVQEKSTCDSSFADYQDYTLKTNISNAEIEEPVFKKRKLIEEEQKSRTEENIDKPIKKNINADENVENNVNSAESNNFEHRKLIQISPNKQDSNKGSAERCEENINNLNVQLPFLDLSDPDSNDSQNFALTYSNNNISHSSVNDNMKENIEDTPPFELTQKSEALSELPVIDLGEDFELDDYLNINKNGKENNIKNTNPESLYTKDKLDTKNTVTLKEWSKGHVSGLQGGTDIELYTYVEPNKSSNNDTHGNVCEGFLKFSKHIRPEVLKQNPNMTAPQIAHTVTSLWKKLSSEERGYYRDLARDEKADCDRDKLKTKEKDTVDTNSKDKNRLLKALEKIKRMNYEKKENLVMRTTVPWDIDIKKVTEKFRNNSSCEHTNLVVGLLCSNLWIVYKSTHIWILDVKNLKKELHIPETNMNKDSAENIGQLLQQWFSLKNDLSLLYPIHSVTKIKNSF